MSLDLLKNKKKRLMNLSMLSKKKIFFWSDCNYKDITTENNPVDILSA